MEDRALLDRLGIDAVERAQRLAFLTIGDEDRERLLEVADFVESIVDDLVDVFYDHVLAFPETAAFLEDPALVDRLKRAQREHFIGLVRGREDADYFESRLRVGMVHAAINLEPRWYLGGYAIQLRYLQGRLFEAFGHDPVRLEGYLASLLKVIILDVSLTTDAYIHSGFVERSLAEAHRHEAERARQALAAKQDEEARKEQLLNMVVHDIRSPVTAMMASARVGLRRSPDTDRPPGKQFALIESSGATVLKIIDDMLTIARTAGGEIPVKLESFDAAELVRSCVEELRPFALVTGHTVRVEGHQEIPVAALDRMVLRRIVSNLLVNAFRHTPTGTQVSVQCTARDDRCIIEVVDDGPGISTRVARSLFDGRASAQSRGPGTALDSGLGLPFCKLACERLNGTIRLAARRQGRGARFVVDLPTR